MLSLRPWWQQQQRAFGMMTMMLGVLSLLMIAPGAWASSSSHLNGGNDSTVSSSVGPVREMQSCHNRTELELSAIEDALPRFIRAKTEQARDFLKATRTTSLRRDLNDLVYRIKTNPESVRVCFEFNPGKLAKKMLNAWAQLFINLGVKVELLQTAFMFNGAPSGSFCTFHIVWGIRSLSHLHNMRTSEFPHMLVMDYSPFWRRDPDFQDAEYAFFGWDYLYGSSLNFVPADERDRWHRIFADKIQISPWADPQKPGNALVLGQMPGEFEVLNTELKHGSLEEAYRKVVQSLNATLPDMPVVYRYRPSPASSDSGNSCPHPQVENVTSESMTSYPLMRALKEAKFAISVSSSALVEAMALGIPVVALDSQALVWPAGCQSLELAQLANRGLACRPDRTQFFEKLAYSIWSADEVRDGIAFDHLFHTDLFNITS